jgi:hypothetical protein
MCQQFRNERPCFLCPSVSFGYVQDEIRINSITTMADIDLLLLFVHALQILIKKYNYFNQNPRGRKQVLDFRIVIDPSGS